MSSHLHVGICILAGGLGRRLKQEKATVRLGRRTLLGYVRQTAEQVGRPVRVIRKDLVPRCGPLGGVYTALKTSRHEAELFLSCDMPFVSAELILGVLCAKPPVFVEHDGRVGFPFMLAVKELEFVQGEIKATRFSLHNLAERLAANRLSVDGLQARQLFNVNTPADLEEARRVLAELAL